MIQYTVTYKLQSYFNLTTLYSLINKVHQIDLSDIDLTKTFTENNIYAIKHYPTSKLLIIEIDHYTYTYNYEYAELMIQLDYSSYIPSKMIDELIDQDLIHHDSITSGYGLNMVFTKDTYTRLCEHQFFLPVLYLPYRTLSPDKIYKELKGLVYIFYEQRELTKNKPCILLPNQVIEVRNLDEIKTYVLNYLRQRHYPNFNIKKAFEIHLEEMYEKVLLQGEQYENQINDFEIQCEELKNKIYLEQARGEDLDQELSVFYDQEDQIPLILKGNEEELYDFEQHDMLLRVLKEYKKKIPKNSNKQQLVDHLLEINPPKGQYEYYRSELYRICKAYRDPNEAMISEVESLIFNMTKIKNNHYQISFKKDKQDRYHAEFSASASDIHSSDATRRDILNKFLF